MHAESDIITREVIIYKIFSKKNCSNISDFSIFLDLNRIGANKIFLPKFNMKNLKKIVHNLI